MDNPAAPIDTQQEQAFERLLHEATPHAYVTPLIIAANIIVFAAMVALGVQVLGGRAEEYLRFGANFAPLTTGGEWWRLFTCTFIHFGIVHLACNLWALWYSGRLAERLFGNAWFAALYIFAGVFGSSASIFWNQEVISGGASGAVFGVFGALLAYMAKERGSIPDATLNHLRISTSTFVVYSLFYGFVQSDIDNAAHLGGLAAGFIMGLVLARPLDEARRRDGRLRRAALGGLLALVMLPTAALYTPDISRVYREAHVFQKELEAFSAEEKRLQTAFMAIAEKSRAKKIDAAAALNELRTDILPAWDAAVVRFASIELDAKAPSRQDYDLLLRYAIARRDGMHAVANYLATNDAVQEKIISEQREIAAAALKQYQTRQK
ncbi:MAG TPA: rhomboid family intramembrane serine protease [Burkholderiales bacterium]|nr:rhomboid family intramembrane serine protease [Burkholderiales bacterium]